MKQLLNGISEIHKNLIIHRDLKPANVLISKNNEIKIIDFGLSRYFDLSGKYSKGMVTPLYRAPELFLD